MAYRSTKEKAEAQKAARKLYVEDGLSLEEISQQTGETVKTLRAWRNLGEWETVEENAKTELDRLKDLRSSMLDRAEAQIKEDKLPHIEIGLMFKLDRMIVQREQKKQELPERVALTALRQFGPRMSHFGGELSDTYREIMLQFGKSIVEQGFPPPSK